MRFLISIVFCSLLFTQAGGQDTSAYFVSQRLGSEEFLGDPRIMRILKTSGNFKMDSLRLPCDHEVILYDYSRGAHANGMLYIIRYNDVGMEVYREWLERITPTYQQKVIALDSSQYVYREFVSLIGQTTGGFIRQTEKKTKRRKSSSPFYESVFLTRNCNSVEKGVASFIPPVYKENNESYPNSKTRDFLRFINYHVEAAHQMVELADDNLKK